MHFVAIYASGGSDFAFLPLTVRGAGPIVPCDPLMALQAEVVLLLGAQVRPGDDVFSSEGHMPASGTVTGFTAESFGRQFLIQEEGTVA